MDTLREAVLTTLEAISTLLQPPIIRTRLAIYSTSQKPPPLSMMPIPRPLKNSSVRLDPCLTLSIARRSSLKKVLDKIDGAKGTG